MNCFGLKAGKHVDAKNQERHFKLAYDTNNRLLSCIKAIQEQILIIQNKNKPQIHLQQDDLWTKQYKHKQHKEAKH